MRWVVGIDEAGYGPNLGPLVQAAVALRLPADDPAGWDTLRPWVRRCHEAADDRTLIDDSKKVYAGTDGLAKLERTVAAVFPVEPATWVGCAANWLTADRLAELAAEPWHLPGHPIACGPRSEVGGMCASPRVNLVHPAAFNALTVRTGSKAAVLADGLVRLLAALPDDDTPVHVVCDKQGGRNFYGPMLAAAFPDGWVVPLVESAVESRYRVDGLPREVTIVFRPRADGDSVAVALASMVCKFVREVCMLQFNAFWAKHVPGLKPTAGYPVDARRFLADIRPAMEALGMNEDTVWRVK